MTNNHFPSETSFGDDGMEARLWEYIDGIENSAEKSAIEKLIEENTAWRTKYAALLELHQMMQSSELEEPSMRFTKNIMDEIAKLHIAPATKSYINKKVIWSLGAFFFITIFSFLVFGFTQVDWSAGSSSGYTISFKEIDYSPMFNNTYMNIFMMFNIVLGLILFDKYLANKRDKLLGKE